MRHDELRERARKLLMQARKDSTTTTSPVKVFLFFFFLFEFSILVVCFMKVIMKYMNICTNFQSEEERQAQLRERARKLIADARMGITPTDIIQKSSQDNTRISFDEKEKNTDINEELNNVERRNSGGKL